MGVSLTVAGLLLVVSIVLIRRHVMAWRRADMHTINPATRDFCWRQFRRRVQTSGLVGTIGVMLAAAELVPSPHAKLACWGFAVLFCGWMILLAVADMVATRTFFMQREQQAFLEELRKKADSG